MAHSAALKGEKVVHVFVNVTSLREGSSHCDARLSVEPAELSDIAETEIVLRASGAGAWTGRITDELLERSTGFLYRLALSSAEPGAIWSLRMVDGETERCVLSDSDVMDGRKTWIVGSYAPARAKKPELRAGPETLERSPLG